MKALTSLLVAVTSFGVSNALSSQGPAAGNATDDQSWKAFLQYAKDYKKPYLNDDNNSSLVQLRYSAFANNLKRIGEHNAAFEKGVETHTLALNRIADLTDREYTQMLRRAPRGVQGGSAFAKPAKMDGIAVEWDWRTRNVVTPVKYQGDCGSCWAFSAVAAMESAYALSTGTLESFSEQELVDCTKKGSNTCEAGGYMDEGFQEIIENHKGKIQLEKDYVYTGVSKGVCHANDDKAVGNFSSYVYIPEGDEDALQAAVATVGPVSVAIDASGHRFQLYHSGVYMRKECGKAADEMNHGVVVVGFGTYKNKKEFWIVKNSWSDLWGQNGYVFMSRHRDNQCGIATAALFPVMSKNK